MTIIELLKLPDSDIAKSGSFVMDIFKEYKRLTNTFPLFCDCQLLNYLTFLRNFYGIN